MSAPGIDTPLIRCLHPFNFCSSHRLKGDAEHPESRSNVLQLCPEKFWSRQRRSITDIIILKNEIPFAPLLRLPYETKGLFSRFNGSWQSGDMQCSARTSACGAGAAFLQGRTRLCSAIDDSGLYPVIVDNPRHSAPPSRWNARRRSMFISRRLLIALLSVSGRYHDVFSLGSSSASPV